jgi:hypothetical protein
VFQEELFDENEEEEEEEEDCPFLYCNELFSFAKPGETWFQCT